MARSKWKPPYVNYYLMNSILKNKNRSVIRTMSRSSTILPSFIGLLFEVHTGKTFTKFYIDEKMIGHKLGEFAFTRKVGKIHIKKTKKNKNLRK